MAMTTRIEGRSPRHGCDAYRRAVTVQGMSASRSTGEGVPRPLAITPGLHLIREEAVATGNFIAAQRPKSWIDALQERAICDPPTIAFGHALGT